MRTPRRPVASQRRRRLFLESLENRELLAAGVGVFDPATARFSLRDTATAGTADAQFSLQATGTVPVVGDWNGDGQDDFGVFDPATATWSLKYAAETGDANAGVFPFGETGSIPVVGDWNGDGRDDLGTYKQGQWTLRYGASPGPANAGTFSFGNASQLPVVGDWDGDGTDGIGLFDPATNTWSLRQTASATAANLPDFVFGTGGKPVTGDWNGDGTDGIGVFDPATATWNIRQTASAGTADATFNFGSANLVPVTGDFAAPAAPTDSLATLVLPPIDLDLLGLEVRTSPITVTLSTNGGDGKLLGNVLNLATSLVDLDGASAAVNTVLDSTVGLLNSATLNVDGLIPGSLNDATAGSMQVLELFVAPVHLDLLGLQVDTSTVRVTITATSGQDLVLGNVVTDLMNLFNPPLPDTLSIDTINQKLDQLLTTLSQQLPGIAPAKVPPVPISDGQILNLTVPALDLDLLGLNLETSPITVNASAETGNGLLLGNVLTTALKTLDATPQALSELNTHLNGLLAQVVGVLNSADLSLASGAINALPPVLQSLVSPVLTAPAAGATAPVLDLMIASSDGTSPPVNVDLLGLVVTTSNIEAHLSAKTGDGQVLGNLLYNLANLADPGGPAGLLNLVNLLGAGSLNDASSIVAGSVTPPTTAPEELLTLTVNPLDINLLGLEIDSEPIVVTVAAQGGDGKLLGNLLRGVTTLINVDGIENALNNVLSTTVDLLNSASLTVSGVGSGSFDTGPVTVTPVLDLFVAPVHLDLLGLVATTQPIHLTVQARSGNGQVLGNVVHELANIFNPPLPASLNIDDLNDRLAQLITRLNQQIPGIPPAETPPVSLDPGQFLELTVPAIDVNLLGLLLNTDPITVNATAETGNGQLLGNVLTTVLNTVDATTENLTGLNQNLNTLLAKVVGVLNASSLTLPTGALDPLLDVLKSLTSPTLVSATPATAPILDLSIASNGNGPPVDAQLLGLNVSTSDINAQLAAQTGDGQILGNLLYNVANLLNPNSSSTLLSLLTQLGDLPLPNAPRLNLSGLLSYAEQAPALLLAGTGLVTDRNSLNFSGGKLTISIADGAVSTDRLTIGNIGKGAGQISVDKNKVSFGGVLIGTFTGGSGSTPLVVSLNQNATLPAVQALLRDISFRTLGDAVVDGVRTITFSLLDETHLLSNLAAVTVNVLGVNNIPKIDGFGGAVTYVTKTADQLISAGAKVTDTDAVNFAGGQLTTTISAGVKTGDRLAIRNSTLLKTTSGGQITLGGRLIGNFTGGVDATPLVITFTDLASAADVQTVLRAIAFTSVATTVDTHARTITMKLTDGQGGTSALVTKQLNVSANLPPVLSGIGGVPRYRLNGPALALAAAAKVADGDSHDFAGGKLTVAITKGADLGNRVFIAPGVGFVIDGREIRRHGDLIGTINRAGGIGKTDLEITFTAKATAPVVQELIRALRFRTRHSTNLSDRVFAFTLTDGDGGSSDVRLKTVDVVR